MFSLPTVARFTFSAVDDARPDTYIVVVVAAVVVACPVWNNEAKRLVEDATVAKKSVDVALLVVALRPVKF